MGRPVVVFLGSVLLLAVAGCGQPGQEEESDAGGPGAGSQTSPEATGGGTIPDSELIQGLRDGGYVIYFRHAATEAGGVNGTETLGDRGAQRNLSAEGREQSETIGGAFEELDIPVGEVFSSPYFRNTDTAELAFGRAQPADELLGLLSVEGDEEERNRRFLKDQLSAPPGEEGNTVLVSHTSNLEEVGGVTLEEGEAAVYEPLGDGEFELRARLMPGEWGRLPDPP